MAVFKIPTIPGRLQRFDIVINGTRYGMRLLYNTAAGSWMMDLIDEADVPVLAGIPLVTGVDLIAQHRHLNIGVNARDGTRVQMLVMTFAMDKPPDTIPTFENLGVDGFLYYVTVPNV
jgi:hypothetical protein